VSTRLSVGVVLLSTLLAALLPTLTGFLGLLAWGTLLLTALLPALVRVGLVLLSLLILVRHIYLPV
jgi:hypothetical protein